MGYKNPTPIQAQAIPLVLQHKDLIACAQTGTGKTASYLLPILHHIAQTEKKYINTLILSPTRELAQQIDQQVEGLAYFAGISSIEGVLVPAGTSTVYDQVLGTNIRRPFLHVRYRASQSDDRRMKSWLTGSAGGAFTSTLDAMEVNFLSERCLVTQAANNFVLFKGI